MYNEKDLVRIAKRENNNKRSYLVVNRLQGKHIPVRPKEAIEMFQTLADKIQASYPKEKLLLIGFAETATAIGAAVSCYMKAWYIQTTRERVEGAEYLFFSEEHSHATEQKLVKNDLDKVIPKIDRIIFIEDEVTTGNTIQNIVKLLKKEYQKPVKFAVASLLNGMKEEHQNSYKEMDIDMLYLVKTDHEVYGRYAELAKGNGNYKKADGTNAGICNGERGQKVDVLMCRDYQNARRLVKGEAYQNACDSLWRQIEEHLKFAKRQKVLVLGSEECMFPGLYAAYQMEQKGIDVCFHATTRSPIAVSLEQNYPLHTRYELKSLYDNERVTFVYDLRAYDLVLIITDAVCEDSIGKKSIQNALYEAGNTKLCFVQWHD